MNSLVTSWGDLGAIAILGIAGVGSAIGCGIAGMSAIASWKRAYLQNKAAPFLLIAFVGAPLTQTIYAFILMNTKLLATDTTPENFMLKLGAGVFGGLAMAFSAAFQGKSGASACDAFGETGKGFANDIIVLGVVETVAVFVLAFLYIVKL